MALKLMFITNRPDVMAVAENVGIDRIFIDLETLGKESRQPNMDTVKSFHTVSDVKNAREVLHNTELLVRINSIWEGSKAEIDSVIDAGAGIVMLPYFKTAEEVKKFVSFVGGRARTCLLFETDSAVDNVDEILSVGGIDEAHIGINDLHLCYKKHFMFEMLTDGTVEYLCGKFKCNNIPYGFGGIARLGYGDVPAEMIIAEHYRLGSSMAIVSRQFCKVNENTDIEMIKTVFQKGINEIREYEEFLRTKSADFFIRNRESLLSAVQKVVDKKVFSLT